MLTSFTKAQTTGNDFILLDLISQRLSLNATQIQRLADRHLGIGCDQLLTVEAPRDPDMDFFCRIYNADGSEAEQCGNGARCLARFVHGCKLTRKKKLRMQTIGGSFDCELLDDGQVRVNLGHPVWTPAEIPFIAEECAPAYKLEIEGLDSQEGLAGEITVAVVSMGNPHAVMTVSDLARAPVTTLGPRIASHPAFPQRVNVGFLQVRSRSQVGLRVFERGAGETLACGSGACAAVVTARNQGLIDARVDVSMPGGTLAVEWQGEGQPVYLDGSAERVFEGRIKL